MEDSKRANETKDSNGFLMRKETEVDHALTDETPSEEISNHLTRRPVKDVCLKTLDKDERENWLPDDVIVTSNL